MGDFDQERAQSHTGADDEQVDMRLNGTGAPAGPLAPGGPGGFGSTSAEKRWDTAPGLKKVADTWDKQVKVLMGRLGSEQGALRGASGLFVRNDIGLGDQFQSIGTRSKLNGL